MIDSVLADQLAPLYDARDKARARAGTCSNSPRGNVTRRAALREAAQLDAFILCRIAAGLAQRL